MKFGDEWQRYQQIFSYDPETGFVTRAVSTGNVKAGSVADTRNDRGYLVVHALGRRTKVHRLAWLLHYGDWPQGEIDHINRDKADNRITNLRVVSRAENCRNRGLRRDNISGVTGVTWRPDLKRWRATISAGGRIKHIGHFDTVEAASAALIAAKEA